MFNWFLAALFWKNGFVLLIFPLISNALLISIWWKLSPSVLIPDALRDLVPFVQFDKREKHPLGSVTFLQLY